MSDPLSDPADASGHRPGDDHLLDIALEGARAGDEDAFRRLYRALSPRLLNYARAMVGEAEAEDVTSEAWSQIAAGLKSFRGDADRFRGWTATITRNRAVDHLRRRRPTVPLLTEELTLPAARDDTEQDAAEAIGTTEALAIIATLPPEQAQAVLLRVVIGLDAPAAGRVLGKRPGAVRTAAHRGLRALARHLRPAESGTDVEPLQPDVAPSASRTGRAAR
jgi:RNA polymerase sigma-70 factor (ECF subfamily)